NPDLLRLHRLGHFTDQIDGQQTVGQIGVCDTHEVSQLEAAFETAVGDADMQHLAVIGLFALTPLHNQKVLMRGDVEIVLPEARYRESDAVSILAAPLDIERWVVVAGVVADLVLQQVEQPIEPDGGAAIRGKIETVHRNKSSNEQSERAGTRSRGVPRRIALAARCDKC